MKVDLQEVINAIEDADDETQAYYYPETEEIIYDNIFDPSLNTVAVEELDGLIELPDRRTVDDYHNMELFIDTVKDDKAAEWLTNAIHGRGAFRMFRATAERFDLLQDWYDFRDRQHRILAIEWCEDNGIEYESSYAKPADDEDEYDDDEDDTYGFDIDYTEEKKTAAPPPAEMPKEIRIVPVTGHNSSNIVYMMADCEKELAALKHIRIDQDIEKAQKTIDDALKEQALVFAAVKDGRYNGFMILKEEENECVLTSLYVRKEWRRQGIGTALFESAKQTAFEMDKELTVVMRPDIDKMLQFLQKNGWDYLSEIRISEGADKESDGSVPLLHSKLKF